MIRDFEIADEDLALIRAIEEGAGEEIVDEREVFELLEDLAAIESPPGHKCPG